MGLFSLFRKKGGKQENDQSTLLKLQGPKYLKEHLAIPSDEIKAQIRISNPEVQWMGQLVSAAGNREFQIKYYGDLMNEETIIDTDNGVQRVIAIDTKSNEEILLFDKMLHGWDGFITNAFEGQKNTPRIPDKLYIAKNNTDIFTIGFVAYYNNGTKQELMESVTSEGVIQLDSGLSVDLQDAFDDGFDAVVIYAFDEKGNKFELVNEELA